jgi:hypothetical protein
VGGEIAHAVGAKMRASATRIRCCASRICPRLRRGGAGAVCGHQGVRGRTHALAVARRGGKARRGDRADARRKDRQRAGPRARCSRAEI